MYKKFKEIVEKYETIILFRHSRPDGDALGSQLGLMQVLQLNYPLKTIYVVGDANSKFEFLGQMNNISIDVYPNALGIVLDSSEEYMVGNDDFKKCDYIIKIDHHISKKDFGNFAIVKTEYESCCGLVFDICEKCGFNLNKEACQYFFTGLVTDSGRFRYPSTTSKTFKIASKLVEYGIDYNAIYDKIYVDSLKMVKIKAQATLNFQLTKNNVGYLINTKEDIKKYDVDFPTVSRGLVGVMSGISEVPVWVNFTEDEENDCIVAELRSRKLNVNKIAVKYGGGGHLNASGASLNSYQEVEEMLKDLDNLVEEENGNKTTNN